MGIRFLEETGPKIRFLPPPIDLNKEIPGVGVGTATADVSPEIQTDIPGVGISQQVDGLDFIPSEKPKVKFLASEFNTPETMMSEDAPEANEALAKTFLPSVEPGAVLPLGEATPFMDIAEPETGLADDPFRNLRTVMNLGFMTNPATAPFAGFSLAGEALKDVEQPMLGHLEELTKTSKFDTHENLMSEVHEDSPLFSKIVGDLELLYLTGSLAKSIGGAEKIVEKSLRSNGRRLDAKTVEEFLEKPLLSATEADVREIISARKATGNRVSGKKFLDELKAQGLEEDAARWRRFMIEERQAGADQLQTAVSNNKIRGELPEVSKSTMDAVHPVRKDVKVTKDFIQKDLGEGFTGSVPRRRVAATQPTKGSLPKLGEDEFRLFPKREITEDAIATRAAVGVEKGKRSEPWVSLEDIDIDVFPEEIKGHNSAEFDELEPAFVRAKIELDRVAAQEAKLGAKVDAVVGKEPPPGGLSIKKVGKPTPEELGEFKFEDPEIESRFDKASGLPAESLSSKVSDKFTTLKNRATRNFEHLPAGAQYAKTKLDLVRLQKKSIAADRATRILDGISKKLTKNSDNIFTRKIILDDLSFEAAEGRELPFGFTREELASELSRVNSVVSRSAEVQEAVRDRTDAWEAIRSDYVAAAKSAGVNLEGRFNNPSYFRHQILAHAQNASGGSGKGVKAPTSKGFLKTRGGSQLDINTNYLEADYEVMSQMLHDIEVYEFISNTNKRFDIKKSLKEEFGDEWRSNVPKGYSRHQWQDGQLFYQANTIPEKIANQLLIDGLKEIGLSADDVGTALAVGGLKNEVVIPTELAETLKEPFPDQNILPFGTKAIRAWKVWALTSPRRIGRFSIRNMTGDAENVYLGNPRGFEKTAESTKELWQMFKGDGAMSEDMREFFKLGGFESTLQFQELQDMNKLPNFKHIRDVETPISGLPKKAWDTYWKGARNFVNFRESILRLSNFKSYKQQMKKSSIGAPANFGASIPEEIMALPTIPERAYKLSNDLLGAYDEITVTGRALRNQLIPFHSFQELNMRKYYRLLKNLKNHKQTQEMLGRIAIEKGVNPDGSALVLVEVEPGIFGLASAKNERLVQAGKMTAKAAVGTARFTLNNIRRIGTFVFSALSMWVLTNSYNETRYPDIEKSLPENIRSRPHIILGVDKNGDPQVFTRIGVLGDALEWFGLDTFPSEVQSWQSGEKTLGEIITGMIKSPINKVAGGSRPFIKLAAEIASRRTFFPDVFEPRTIRDRGFHIARSFGLGSEYVALMGLPSEGYMETMSDFYSYSIDPGASAYFEVIDKKNRFRKKVLGKVGEGSFVSPKGNALYNYKLALRLDDKDAQSKFLEEYIRLSGITSRRQLSAAMKQTIKSADPLFGLKEKEKLLFVSQLSEDDRDRLVRAMHYYGEIIQGED